MPTTPRILSRIAPRIGALALPFALLAIPSLAGTAQAADTVFCGATIKSSVTLTADLNCANGKGVTLYRGVTLNLGGHKLVGPGAAGTAVTLSYKGGSSITNGTIQGWGNGVAVDSTDLYPNVPTATINKVTLTNAPVAVTYSVVTVSSSTFIDSPISVTEAKFTATASAFTRSSIDGFDGQISLTSTTVVGGSVDDTGAFGVRIDRSTLDGTGYSGGISTCSETDVTITDSIVKNYAQPISGYYCTVNLTGNTFSNNKGGVLGRVTDGFMPGDVNTTVADNTFTANGIAINSGAMRVTGNTFGKNATGVLAEDPENTTVTDNTFSANTSSGLRTLGAGMTVGGNNAVNNGRYGIYAPGAIDLGGNTASGNGMSPECVGVVCSAP